MVDIDYGTFRLVCLILSQKMSEYPKVNRQMIRSPDFIMRT